MKEAPDTCAATCVYCEEVLAPRHEHDHAPLPKRNGGTQVFCACMNCHERKDRTPLDNWPASVAVGALSGLWSKLNTDERILLMKLAALCSDAIRKMGADESGGSGRTVQ